jgi:hypothetical protein
VVNNSTTIPNLCGAPTGGPYLGNERWCRLGVFHVRGERMTFALVSDGKFPIARMLRVLKTD